MWYDLEAAPLLMFVTLCSRASMNGEVTECLQIDTDFELVIRLRVMNK